MIAQFGKLFRYMLDMVLSPEESRKTFEECHELMKILSACSVERGRVESPVETLKRILEERDKLRSLLLCARYRGMECVRTEVDEHLKRTNRPDPN